MKAEAAAKASSNRVKTEPVTPKQTPAPRPSTSLRYSDAGAVKPPTKPAAFKSTRIICGPRDPRVTKNLMVMRPGHEVDDREMYV